MMQKIEQALRVIAGQSSGEIREAVATLDQVLADSREKLSPSLIHYLEGRSYIKALAFIEKEQASK